MIRLSGSDNGDNGRRRRRWTASQKAQAVEETMTAGMTVSSVARKYGIPVSLLFRWRRLMADEGAVALHPYRDARSGGEVQELKRRIWELERLIGKMTMENETLRETLAETTKSKKLLFINRRTRPQEEGS